MSRHPCYEQCSAVLLREVAEVLAAKGHDPIDLRITCTAPRPPRSWWWECYLCPHHREYWMRPTEAQHAKWEKDRTP